MLYYVTYRHGGDTIECFDTKLDAQNYIHFLEEQDKANDRFDPDFYAIVEEDSIPQF